MGCVSVGDREVLTNFRIVEPNHADIARIPMKSEFSFVLGEFRMRRVDPWPQHIVVVVHMVDQDSVTLNGALDVGGEIDA